MSRLWMRAAAATLIVALGSASRAMAAEWMVLESSAGALVEGERLSGEQPIEIPAHAQLTVVSVSGRTLEVEGPYQGTLERAARISRGSPRVVPRDVRVGVTRGVPAAHAPAGSENQRMSWLLDGVPLRIGVGSLGDTAEEVRLRTLLQGLQRDRGCGIALRLVQDAQAGDWSLAVNEGRIWFLHPEDPARQMDARLTYSVPLASSEMQARAVLLYALRRIARTATLLELAREAAPDGVHAALTFTRAGGGERERIERGKLATFQHGDDWLLEVDNRSSGPVDVTVFFIDGRQRMIPLLPGVRLESGETKRIADTLDISQMAGVEGLLVMALPTQPGGPRANLASLAAAVYRQEGAVPGVARGGLAAQLAPAGYSATSAADLHLPAASIRLFSWRTRASHGDSSPR